MKKIRLTQNSGRSQISLIMGVLPPALTLGQALSRLTI
jgi:hypothetical protein